MAIGDMRQPRRIQETLDRVGKSGLSFADVQRAVGIRSYHTVWATMHGKKNNRKVLRHLLLLGVSPEVLDLPDDLLVEVQAQQKEAV